MNFKNFLDFIPKKRNIVLHVRLKQFKKKNNDYKNLSQSLIFYFKKNFKIILIPSFTYSFCKKKNINLKTCGSEVGKFSEEIRKTQKSYRTFDPIFSFINFDNRLKVKKRLSKNSFDDDSIFKIIYKKKFLIINIGLDEIVSSQFHKIEFDNNVPYRYNKLFKGRINNQKISYNYFVRDKNYSFNRKKILEDLLKEKIVKEKTYEKIKVRYFDVWSLTKYLNRRIKQDNYYLVNKN